MRVRWLIPGLMMGIVAMHSGNCQRASLTTNYDAFLQAYYEWQQAKNKLLETRYSETPPTPEQLAAFYDKTRELATAAVQWCHQEPGLWRRFWRYYAQPKSDLEPIDLKGYVSQMPTYTPEQLQELCRRKDPRHPQVHYQIVKELLYDGGAWLPSEQERVAWTRHLLELSLQFYQSSLLRQGADRYQPAVDPFADIPVGQALVVGFGTDFSYQAALWRERAEKEVRIRRKEEPKPCEVPFEVVYSPVPLQQPLPPDEPDYDYLADEAFFTIRDARGVLQQVGALPADDWLLIAGWQVWQLPKDKAFLCVRSNELYLSHRALQQLQVRFVVMGDRVMLWNGSYRQAVLLDGRDGFREGGEVWVRVLALKEKGLFAVAEHKVFRMEKERRVRMFSMGALRPVADESGKQEER